MIYLYSLLEPNFSYPNIRNILCKTYLENKQVKYKYIDYTVYFLNEILNNKNIKKIKHDIKDTSKDLLSANEKFIKATNKYLNEFGIIYRNNKRFDYKHQITCIDDFVRVSNEIKKFIDLFPIDKYKDKDIIFMNISYGFQIPMTISLCKRIKKNNKNVKVVWNGNYLTQINKNCSELIKKVKVVDAIILFNHLKTFNNIINYFNIRRTLNFINRLKYIDLFGLNVFVLARNSRLCDSLNHNCSDINITYRFKNDKKEKLEELIRNFKNKKKVNRVNVVKSKILSRSDYLYLNRYDFSINYREV